MGQIEDVLNVARSYIGIQEQSTKHREIVDIYNGYRPLARGYYITPYDAWCMAFVSVCFIKANAVSALGRTECGCQEYLNYAKSMGMTVSKSEARYGDIVLYDWGQDGRSDHVGIVESVSGPTLKVIEGNKSDSVGYRNISIGNGQISGVVRPHYKNVATLKPYDKGRVSYAAKFERAKAGKYKCTASDYLNLRYNPFEGDNIITKITSGDTVQNYGYYTGEWLLVTYKEFTGFAHMGWLKKI